MANKLLLTDIATSYASTFQLNNNFTAIEDEFDKVLYRQNPTGEANEMYNDLDMNSNDIINTNSISSASLTLNGETRTDWPKDGSPDTGSDIEAKLDASIGTSWKTASTTFKGMFPTEAALLALPTTDLVAGDYAQTDGGAGNDVINWAWDVDDGQWVKQLGQSNIIPIINDTTTGGTASALSAEQGKNLQEEVDHLNGYKDKADVVANAPKVVGTKIKILDSTGIGHTWVAVSTTSRTDTGTTACGLVIAAGSVFYERVFDGDIHVGWFGDYGKGDDDYAVLQLASDQADTIVYNFSGLDIGSATFMGATRKLVFETSVCFVSDTVTYSSQYIDVCFNKTLFMPFVDSVTPANSFDLTKYLIDITVWNGTVQAPRFANGNKGIYLHNANLDIGKIEVRGLQASNMDEVCAVECRSSIVTFTEYRFDRVKIACNIISGDKVIFDKGWLSAAVFDQDNSAHFVMAEGSHSPSLVLVDFFYVPVAQTANKCTIVKIPASGGRVYFNEPLCGGEPGQIPLVANYGKTTLGRGTHISIKNGSSFTTTGGRACVELYDLPNSIVIEDMAGMVEEGHLGSLVDFIPDVRTFAEAEAGIAAGADFEMYFKGYTYRNFNGLPRAERAELAKYVRSQSKVIRGYVAGVTNTVQGLITELNGNLLRRYQTYKINITNITNGGSDRYSEYVLAGNVGGNGYTLTPIFEGASTVSARLSVLAGTDVKVLANGSTSPLEFAYEIQKVSSVVEGY